MDSLALVVVFTIVFYDKPTISSSFYVDLEVRRRCAHLNLSEQPIKNEWRNTRVVQFVIFPKAIEFALRWAKTSIKTSWFVKKKFWNLSKSHHAIQYTIMLRLSKKINMTKSKIKFCGTPNLPTGRACRRIFRGKKTLKMKAFKLLSCWHVF